MKKMSIVLFFGMIFFASFGAFAQEDLYIIPKADSDSVGTTVDSLSKGGKVWDIYDEKSRELEKSGDLGAQMASGIFTWDTLLDYLVYLIRFLSQAGIFVGACYIIYAGYIYASHVFTGKDVSSGNKAISNAILGVVVITFSYAIMKAVTAAFLT